MFSKRIAWIVGITFCITAGLASRNLEALGQAQQDKSPREKFGSSLKKPRSDPPKREVDPAETKNNEPPIDEGDVVRINTRLVAFDVLVVNPEGEVVSGLTKDDFVLTQEDKPQTITTFALGNDLTRRRSIVLIIDRSRSQLPYIQTSVQAAKILVQSLGPLDQMAIVTDDIKLVTEFTNNRLKLISGLDSVKKKVAAGARQYSALMATLRELVKQDQRTIVIFQTDGDQLRLLRDSESNLSQHFPTAEFSLRDVYVEAEKSRATVYSIIPGFRLVGLSLAEQLSQLKKDSAAKINKTDIGPFGFWQSILKMEISDPNVPSLIQGPLTVQLAMAGVAKLSGGQTEFLEDPSQAEGIYRRILNDANRRYLIGFQPASVGNGNQRRSVRIEVRGHPEYSVLGRKSYY